MSSRTPITVMWNKHLPHFDSTLEDEDQDFKVFTFFPDDLPYNYGSLTAMRTSVRPWVGRSGVALEVPDLEFFATTGEYKDEQEWRNPEGTWFRQIIPQGWVWKSALSSRHPYSTRATTRRSTEILEPAPAWVPRQRLRSLHLKKFHVSKRCQALPRRLTILLPRANFFAKLFRWDFGISTCLHQRFSP